MSPILEYNFGIVKYKHEETYIKLYRKNFFWGTHENS